MRPLPRRLTLAALTLCVLSLASCEEPTYQSAVCTERGFDGEDALGVPEGTWPGTACTGPIEGSALTVWPADTNTDNDPEPDMVRLEVDGTTITNAHFTAPVCVAAADVSILNSLIDGTVWMTNTVGEGPCGDPDGNGAANLTLTDVEINGGGPGVGVNSDRGQGVSCFRCDVHHVGAAVNGSNWSMVSSYVHDLLGVYDCTLYPGDCISHNDGVQGNTGRIVVWGNHIDATLTAGSPGGVSCAVCLYTHGDRWGPMDDVRVRANLLTAQVAAYCAWAGGSAEQNPTNIRFEGNVFGGQCSPVGGWERNTGNVWTGNSTLDGTPIPEP